MTTTGELLSPLLLNHFGVLEFTAFQGAFITRKNGCERRVMPRLGIWNIRAKYTEREEGEGLPVARCP